MSELNREQRVAILDGRRPKLTWPRSDECPVTEGQQLKLEARVWVTILKVSWSKAHWMADYRVRDDRPRLLRAGLTPTVTQRSQKRHWTPNEEHGYTEHAGNALPDEPEAVDDDELRRQRVKAEERWAEHRSESASDEERRKQERAVRQKLRETLPTLTPQAQIALLAGVKRLIEESVPELDRAA